MKLNIVILLIFVLSCYAVNLIECIDEIVQSDCGVTKTCLTWTKCLLNDCQYFVSWKPVEINGNSYLEIELVGKVDKGSNEYVALGFSDDNEMGNDGVVGCQLFNNELGVRAGYNPSKYNQFLDANELDKNYLIKTLNNAYGVEYISTYKQIRCRFARLTTPIKSVDKVKDLSSPNEYYLLNAIGPVKTNTSFSKHYDSTRRPSSTSFNLTSSPDGSNIATVQYSLAKAHGCLMIIGWVIFLTNGMVIAKFYKNNWSSVTIGSTRLWFHLHRAIQISGFLIILSAFVIIFVSVKGYSNILNLPNKAHPILGIVATSLMTINPIMALFRCNPKHKQRPIFNWCHSIVGISSYVIALCAMCIGIKLPMAGHELHKLNYPFVLVIVFIVLMLFLFVGGIIQQKVNNRISDNSDLPLTKDQDPINSEMNSQSFSPHYLIASLILSLAFGLTLIIIVIVN